MKPLPFNEAYKMMQEVYFVFYMCDLIRLTKIYLFKKRHL